MGTSVPGPGLASALLDLAGLGGKGTVATEYRKLEGTSASNADRRGSPRAPFTLPACLIPPGGDAAVGCRCRNIAEGGMFVVAPVGFGLAVGQRYELVLGAMPDSILEPGRDLGAGHYATVVRADLRVGSEGDHVGLGLRFDHPVAL